MKLQTRRQIIEKWLTQDDNILDSYCCPNCRDILSYDSEQDFFYCINPGCTFINISSDKITKAGE